MDTSTLYRIKNGDTGQQVADGLKNNFDTLGAKILEKDEITGLTGYRVNMATLMSESPESEDIATAIGGWDNLVSAVNDRKPVTGYYSGRFTTAVHCEIMSADKIILAVNSETTAIKFKITNTSGTLGCSREDTVLQTASDETFQTDDKTVAGAVNEVNTKVASVQESVGKLEEAVSGVEEILKLINNERI